jgi:hypothetical protein
VLTAIATPAAIAKPSPGAAAPPQIHVPLPDLSRFDQLLGGNETQETSRYDDSKKTCIDQSTEIPVSVFFT